MRPPEHPADHLDAVDAPLGQAVVLARVFIVVMVVQAQDVVPVEGDLMHSQCPQVEQGIEVAIDDPGPATVDRQGGAHGQARLHVAAGQGEADRLRRIDALGLEHWPGQDQEAFGCRLQFALADRLVGQAHDLGVLCDQLGGQRDRPLRVAEAWRVLGRARVLAPLSGQQPAAIDRQQLGEFVEPRQGNAALEPVVDVLGRDVAVRREIGSGQVAFLQEGLEAIAGCLHGDESSEEGDARE